ncbi:MAG TPA: hypothetical protein VEA44_15925 [Caulobacter sp.]|nr:hypothetical protein [Caulobacter sp.]
MRKSVIAVMLAALLAVPTAAPAAKPPPPVKMFDIYNVMNDPELTKLLPVGVKYYFGNQPAAVVKVIGPLKVTRRTTKGKGEVVACRWAMTSALIGLGRNAQVQGGNAVVGIQSNLENIPSSSDTQFKCAIGGMMVNVALIGQAAVVE